MLNIHNVLLTEPAAQIPVEEADMGISPYDSVALIITKYTRERISFRLARVLSDVTVIVVGVVFFLMSHGPELIAQGFMASRY